jgi:O-antigen/teichoic acid export membrane protein
MKKQFLLNMALLVGINLLIKPFYAFGIDLQVQNLVGVKEYGFYFALFNFSYLFQILSDFGLQQYNSRFVAQNPALTGKYLPHFLILKGFLSLLFFTVSLIFAFGLGYHNSDKFDILLLLLLNQVLTTMILFLRSVISGLQLYVTDSILSALDKLLLIVFAAILIWGPLRHSFNISWFVYAQTISLLLTMLVIGILIIRKLKIYPVFKINFPIIYVVIKQSWPYALAVFLMTAYTRIDAVLLERMLEGEDGEIQSGVYAFGYRLIDAFNMIGYLFAGLLLPMYAKLLHKNESITDLLKTAWHWMFFFTAGLSFTVFFFGEELSYWMLKSANSYTVLVLSTLIWSSISAGIIYVFGTVLTANGNLNKMNLIFFVGLILNLTLNLILIPKYGAWGAAITTLSTQSFVAVCELFLVFRLIASTRSLLKFSELFKIILLCMGIWLLFGLMDSYISLYLDWRISIILGVFAALAWSEAIGFLELRGILKFLKKKG